MSMDDFLDFALNFWLLDVNCIYFRSHIFLKDFNGILVYIMRYFKDTLTDFGILITPKFVFKVTY